MLRPTRRLVVVTAAGLGAAAVPAVLGRGAWPVWAVFVALVLAVAVWDVVCLPRRGNVSVTVQAPADVTVGGCAVASVEIATAASRPLSLDLLADLSAELVPQGTFTGTLTAPGLRVPLELRPIRRGRGTVERVWLRLAGPLGCVARVWSVPVGRAIDVVPNVRGSRRTPLRYDERRAARAGVKVERFDGDGSEFDALREFRTGDDHRAIDWKASARHRSLLRRQFRAERDHQVVLALDTGRLMASRLDGIPKLDHAIGAALRLAYVALATGDRVGLFGFDERPRARSLPRGGLRSHAQLLHAAAGLEAREVETNFTLGLATLLQSLRRRSLILVLTDFADTVSAELMVENFRRVARRHVVVFVALTDTALDAIEAAPPVSRTALHRAVIAGTLRRERSVVLERLRRLGVHAIEAPPERLGAAMVSRYLELKRREVA